MAMAKGSRKTKPLDRSEANLMKSLESGEWHFVSMSDQRKKQLIQAAKNSRKEDNINIRISRYEKEQLMDLAAEEGMPYQTLIRSIIYKYQSGRLVDIKTVKQIVQDLK
jgi:predicted DNA binding CopG/RHH family protein